MSEATDRACGAVADLGNAIEGMVEQLRVAFPHGHPKFLDLCLAEAQLHNDKNHDYAAGGRVFGNFERVADILALYPKFPYHTREGVLMIYALKQIDAVLWGLCQGIKAKVEGIRQRSSDISVYSKLLGLMSEEEDAF